MPRRAESVLTSTADVMAALGGPAKVSGLTGAPYKRTWQWGKDPTFPSRYFVVMTWALRRRRLRAPPSLWGQVTIPEMQAAA